MFEPYNHYQNIRKWIIKQSLICCFLIFIISLIVFLLMQSAIDFAYRKEADPELRTWGLDVFISFLLYHFGLPLIMLIYYIKIHPYCNVNFKENLKYPILLICLFFISNSIGLFFRYPFNILDIITTFVSMIFWILLLILIFIFMIKFFSKVILLMLIIFSLLFLSQNPLTYIFFYFIMFASIFIINHQYLPDMNNSIIFILGVMPTVIFMIGVNLFNFGNIFDTRAFHLEILINTIFVIGILFLIFGFAIFYSKEKVNKKKRD